MSPALFVGEIGVESSNREGAGECESDNDDCGKVDNDEMGTLAALTIENVLAELSSLERL